MVKTCDLLVPSVPPSPPTRPDVLSVSANAISIKWDVPYADGGSKVTGYWIEKKERNTILWVRENKLPCLECHHKVSNLIEGLEYQFRVYAMNIAGLSKASEASRPVLALNPVGKEHCSVGPRPWAVNAAVVRVSRAFLPAQILPGHLR